MLNRKVAHIVCAFSSLPRIVTWPPPTTGSHRVLCAGEQTVRNIQTAAFGTTIFPSEQVNSHKSCQNFQQFLQCQEELYLLANRDGVVSGCLPGLSTALSAPRSPLLKRRVSLFQFVSCHSLFPLLIGPGTNTYPGGCQSVGQPVVKYAFWGTESIVKWMWAYEVHGSVGLGPGHFEPVYGQQPMIIDEKDYTWLRQRERNFCLQWFLGSQLLFLGDSPLPHFFVK